MTLLKNPGILVAVAIILISTSPVMADIWYQDMDGDGWGRCDMWVEFETQPVAYVAWCGDCMDDDPDTHPGAFEIPGNGLDENCDGTDEAICYADLDRDGYGDPGNFEITPSQNCEDPDQAYTGTDCNDDDPSIHPGATEIPNDGIDQDCNGEDLFDPTPLKGTPWSLIKIRYR